MIVTHTGWRRAVGRLGGEESPKELKERVIIGVYMQALQTLHQMGIIDDHLMRYGSIARQHWEKKRRKYGQAITLPRKPPLCTSWPDGILPHHFAPSPPPAPSSLPSLLLHTLSFSPPGSLLHFPDYGGLMGRYRMADGVKHRRIVTPVGIVMAAGLVGGESMVLDGLFYPMNNEAFGVEVRREAEVWTNKSCRLLDVKNFIHWGGQGQQHPTNINSLMDVDASTDRDPHLPPFAFAAPLDSSGKAIDWRFVDAALEYINMYESQTRRQGRMAVPSMVAVRAASHGPAAAMLEALGSRNGEEQMALSPSKRTKARRYRWHTVRGIVENENASTFAVEDGQTLQQYCAQSCKHMTERFDAPFLVEADQFRGGTRSLLYEEEKLRPTSQLRKDRYHPPELLKLLPLTAPMAESLTWLPSLLYLIEVQQAIQEFRHTLLSRLNDRLSSVDQTQAAIHLDYGRLVEALTCPLLNSQIGATKDVLVDWRAPADLRPSGCRSDYQRLEWLGDAVLKFLANLGAYHACEGRGEGPMTSLSSQMKANEYLRKMCKEHRFYEYTWAQPFSRRRTVESTRAQTIGDKTLADIVESIMGAIYLSNIHHDDTKIEVDDVANDAPDYQRGVTAVAAFVDTFLHMDDMPCLLPLLYAPTANDTAMANGAGEARDLGPIEAMWGRQFHDQGLLRKALTSRSCVGAGVSSAAQTNEELEFVGDAVLEVLVCHQIFFDDTPAAPSAAGELISVDPLDTEEGRLTDRKKSLLSNRHLCERLLARLRDAPSGRLCISDVLRVGNAAQRDHLRQLQMDWEARREDWSAGREESGVKHVGDLYEALVGATYVDSGGDLLAVWRVISPDTCVCR
ncbi:unnamed protein product [Vitrella brassicaformis CCMP3155]|uniref:RNase III domain-containing protein n=1 Tax=Vitrella brassicaformis (strain CCMP3155) TaxID=1169540 RepID=A0A0G4EP92_VITBC|nr:unnamed protein product [Vitrella brassicaformis CCMP3155]|eukprot:CEL98693.1 unnamed protein product [Vitrella brassicaformis CCMP3155]